MMTDQIGCDDCKKHFPYQEIITSSTNLPESELYQYALNNYDDILGPDHPPTSNWCEEVVLGVATSMQVIATAAPNLFVRSALIGVIETLKQKGIKCCQAGGFWKACVAPISRKWREWNSNKENNIPPSVENLSFYVD